MKLTEDDIDYFGHYDIKGRDRMEIIKQQILDDYEKARKYDEIKNHKINQISFSNVLQNQKLRELVEKRIEHEKSECKIYHDAVYPYCLEVLQKLLEESKK